MVEDVDEDEGGVSEGREVEDVSEIVKEERMDGFVKEWRI